MNRKTVLFLVVATLGIGIGFWIFSGAGSRAPSKGRVPHDSVGGDFAQNDMVRVEAPSPEQSIESPLHIEGEARGGWYFEGSFPVTLRSEDGSVIARHYATAEDEWMTDEFVRFSAKILFSHPDEGNGWLILHRSNPSGLPEHDAEARIPVHFADIKTMKVAIHFGREGATECEETVAVSRVITRTEAPVRAALEHLLAGPTTDEREREYFSPIPSGVTIQRLVIVDGTAEVDFSEQLEAGSGGSCHVQAIRSQIENTLLQFSAVDSVVISVNGRVDDVLQP